MPTRKFEITHYLRTDRQIAAYLDAALADGDPRLLLEAVRDVATVRGGMSTLARRAGIPRESLYRMLSRRGNPSYVAVRSILKAAGFSPLSGAESQAIWQELRRCVMGSRGQAEAFGKDRFSALKCRSTPEWSKRVLELTGGHGADIIVDVGGKDSLPQSVKSLAYWGTLSIVGGCRVTTAAAGLLLKTARAQGIFVGSRADYLRMSTFITQHNLHPVIDRVFALEDYEAALAYMASNAVCR
jgi:probable addiction module antidote protein